MERSILGYVFAICVIGVGCSDGESDDSPVTDLCRGVDCGSHGSCDPETGSCSCETGYMGEDCSGCASGFRLQGDRCIAVECEDAAACSDGNPCNGEEVCTNHQCESGAPVQCGNHETCDPQDGACHCATGYEGQDCESCADGYVAIGDDCVAGSCVTDSDCDDGDPCNGEETCGDQHACEQGDRVECGEHGECMSSTGECTCETGYEGNSCEACADGYAMAEGSCLLAVTFEDLTVSAQGYWNGADLMGGFESGWAWFSNDHDETTGAWSGFGYSNLVDADHPAPPQDGLTAMAGGGAGDSEHYAVAYYNGLAISPPTLSLTDCPTGCTLAGMYVTNVAAAYYAMLEGGGGATKFGGDLGTDPDWYKLIIQGITETGTYTSPMDFYLADYRPDDSAEDYILTDWTWVDLSGLGNVIGLEILVSSSDTGPMGINTPTYFAVDNLVREP